MRRRSPYSSKVRIHEVVENLLFLGLVALVWGFWPVLLRIDRQPAPPLGNASPDVAFFAFIGPQELSSFRSQSSLPHTPLPRQDTADFIQPDWLEAPATAADFQIALPAPSAPQPAPLGLASADNWTPASFLVPSYRLPRVAFPLEIAPQTNDVWFLDAPDDVSLDEAGLRQFTAGAVDRVDAEALLLFAPDGSVENVLLPPEMTAFTSNERSQLDRVLHRARNLSATNASARIRWYWRK